MKRKWLSLLVIIVFPVLFGSCYLFQNIEVSDHPEEVINGKELQPLLIRPDVSLLREIEVSGEKSLYVSATGIFFQENSEFYPIVASGYPTLVGLSPDKRRLCFIEPSDFEQLSDLYVFDLEKKALRRLTDNLNGSNRVMRAAWLNSREIFFIEGYAFGTQAKGGFLYSIDVEGNNRRRVFPLEKGSESRALAFEVTPNKLLRVQVNGDSEGKVVYLNSDGNVVEGK